MLSLDVMRAVMSEEKKTDLDRVTLKNETLRKYFPKSYMPKQMEDKTKWMPPSIRQAL